MLERVVFLCVDLDVLRLARGGLTQLVIGGFNLGYNDGDGGGGDVKRRRALGGGSCWRSKKSGARRVVGEEGGKGADENKRG